MINLKNIEKLVEKIVELNSVADSDIGISLTFLLPKGPQALKQLKLKKEKSRIVL